MENNIQLQMRELITKLNEYTDKYDAGYPAIPDDQWDSMYYALCALEKEYPHLVFPDSPTQKIHYTQVSELVKVKHEYQPMLSLAKTKDLEEVKDFINGRDWIAMLKLDGLTCRLTYEEGKLVRAETRGNGEEGEDITHNAMVLPSIPKKIPYYDTLVVDGEVICDLKTFEQFKDDYANARNFAAGSIRLLDSKECVKRGLTFVAWDIITEDGDDEWGKLSAKLMYLDNYGFTVAPYFLDKDFEEFDAIIWSLKNIAELEGYPIDGLVFKWDNCKEYETAGRTEHHFRGGLAYKFYDEEYETTLKDIEWSMGRTGVLTPVAIYEDVNIDGAVCNRASLHNINTLTSILGDAPLVGQKVWVVKQNQIIPQITRAQEVGDILGADPAYFFSDPELSFLFPPRQCPVCGGETEVRRSDSGTIELYCTNDDCEGKLINHLDHWAGKKGLDIKHLSKATLEKLIEWGWVSKITDLYNLDDRRREWINKPGFGEKSVDRLLLSIQEARRTDLTSFIAAMGIPLIGRTYAKQLAEIFETYEAFRTAISPDPISGLKPFDFTQIKGFGAAMHDAIMNFNYREFDRLYDMRYIEIKSPESEAVAFDRGGNLEGKIFVVTGKLKNYKNRDLLKAEIEARGGKVVDSVSSKTNYLVNNDINSTSAKNKKAKELGIPIITEEELLSMF